MQFLNIAGYAVVICLVAMTTNVKAPCPADDTPTPGINWYQIPTISKTCFHYEATTPRFWSAAKGYCSLFTSNDNQNTAAYMVKPSTAALQQAITAFATLFAPEKDIWTGGNDQSSEGTWVWGNSKLL